MQQKIEKLIPHAFKAVEVVKLVEKHKEKKIDYISSQYNGYVASFGASVIQSGLVAAVVFYSQKQSGAEKDRRKLMAAILEVLKRKHGKLEGEPKTLLEYVLKRCIKTEPPGQGNRNAAPVFEKVDWAATRRLKQEILDAATAIKLVIRTYPSEKTIEQATENTTNP
jgi:CRISPR-associated protein Cmr5